MNNDHLDVCAALANYFNTECAQTSSPDAELKTLAVQSEQLVQKYKRARTDEHAAPTNDTPPALPKAPAQRFMLIVEHSAERNAPNCMIFLALTERTTRFCSLLVDKLDALSSRRYTIAKKFYDTSTAKMLVQRIAPVLCMSGHYYESVKSDWNEALWQHSKQSLDAYLRKIGKKTLPSTAPSDGSTHFVRREISAKQQIQVDKMLSDYCTAYSDFSQWMTRALDDARQQLFPRLLFLVFQHFYYDLIFFGVNSTTANHAGQFYERFSYQFEKSHADQLREMRKVQTRDHMHENEQCCRLRGLKTYKPSKQLFEVSNVCFNYLQHAMRLRLLPTDVQKTIALFAEFRQRNDN